MSSLINALNVFLIITFVSFDLTVNERPVTGGRPNTIAVIGGGVGGASAAYFVRQLSKQSDPLMAIDVHLYERNGQLGGRLATQTVNSHEYETGGSVIHDRNHYAKELTAAFNLQKRQSHPQTEDKLCLYNGKSFDFCESSYNLITYLKIWFRYGFDVNNLQTKVSQIIDSFENVYRLQESNVKFESVADLLTAMSSEIYNLTKISYKDYLTKAKFSKKFIYELVQSISLVNYGQDVSIPAFVGCVSFAGAGEHLWAIKGGNKLLVKQLADKSEAKISLNTRINSVTQLDVNLFELSVTDEKSGQTSTQRYNSVIIATPLTENQLKFINFSVNLNDNFPKREYHRTVSTLVAGHLNKRFKGRDVLSDNMSTFFTSIGRVYPVDDSTDERTPVYKVFSPKPLTTEQLAIIFDDTQVVYVKDWYAYPHYDYTLRSFPLPPFILSSGLYHLNAIEWAASAIEMSLIGGKNAAILAFGHLGGNTSHSNVFTSTNKPIIDEL